MVALAGVNIHSKQDNRAPCFADTARVVVKLLKQDYPSLQELTRYRQEHENMRSFDLEGVVKAYSQQDYQRALAILLEDFGGKSIEHWMRQRPEAFRPMPLSTFLPLAIDMGSVLSRIHAANIIQKDINPGNIVKWLSCLLATLGGNRQLIIDAVPETELNIGKQPVVPEVGAIEAQNRFHRVFGQFIRVFCSKEHPLVLFLDDLQWIDLTTLRLIELLLLDKQIYSLFLK